MRFLKEKEFIFLTVLLIICAIIGLWGYFGKWFSQSPQDVAQQRGMTIGNVESTNSDGVITVFFDNESIGRKRIRIYPNSWETVFVPDNKEYVRLFFEIKGIKGCEKLSDQELIERYLKKIEVHYKL